MIDKVQNRVDKKACFRKKKTQAITNEEESDEPD